MARTIWVSQGESKPVGGFIGDKLNQDISGATIVIGFSLTSGKPPSQGAPATVSPSGTAPAIIDGHTYPANSQRYPQVFVSATLPASPVGPLTVGSTYDVWGLLTSPPGAYWILLEEGVTIC